MLHMLHTGTPPLIGNSPAVAELRQAITRVARSDSKVLVTGESGVGKEVAARHIWAESARAGRPLITVNCGGLVETLLESELFGQVRGSFTGAYRDRPGQLQIAHLGTIFLDEIGEMTPRMQTLLLRYLETGEIQKVGADQTARVDVRVIAATNRNLILQVAKGAFRADLFYRLNVLHLVVPPLSQRKEDIPALVEHTLQRLRTANGHGPIAIMPEAMTALVESRWPGNIRELQNVIERTFVAARDSNVITLEDLPVEIRAAHRVAPAPFQERRRGVADTLYRCLVDDQQSFWTTVHPLFMRHEITRDIVREIVRRGLQDARGNYKVVARMFNMPPKDYKKFLNFIRKHECQPSFKDFR